MFRGAQQEAGHDPRTSRGRATARPAQRGVIAGDSNRHNPLWKGSHIDSTASQDESAPSIELMAELSLQCLLPEGMITLVSDARRTSTIGLMLTHARADERAGKVLCGSMSTGQITERLVPAFAWTWTGRRVYRGCCSRTRRRTG